MSPSNRSPRVLVVDDSADTLEVLQRNLVASGLEVVTALGVREAVSILEAQAVDLVVTDLKMPGLSGIDLLRHVRENCPDTAALMITGYPSLDGAVQAVKTGAEDFLAKPFTDEELLGAVHAALDKLTTRRLVSNLTEDSLPLIGKSEPMRRARRAVERAAMSDAPVLLVGEDGTGREFAARQIRALSTRGNQPFISVRVSLIGPSESEMEIFGTSAPDSGKPGGLSEAARGGTLYVEGADKAPATLQEKFFRVLSEAKPDSPRLIFAVEQSRGAAARQFGLIDPLFHILSGAIIEMPALADRGDDILLLVGHFAGEASRIARRKTPEFSDEAIRALRAYSWPGNVRELKSVVDRLVASAGTGSIDVVEMPTLLRFSALRDHPWRTLAEVEAEHIANVLKAVDGKRSRAAEILGIDRKTLREKLRRLGLDSPSGDSESE
ncbi:MAG: sigma-54 dependent transcriptional regulator [Candidatus Brocadiia bacterium]